MTYVCVCVRVRVCVCVCDGEFVGDLNRFTEDETRLLRSNHRV